MPNIFLYAPNVHTGGGRVLLQLLLDAWPVDASLFAVFDTRAKAILKVPDRVKVLQWVRPTITSRWAAERVLHASVRHDDMVFCFHGMPPLLTHVGRIVVFMQNRLYFGNVALSLFSTRTAFRLRMERLLCRLFRYHVSEYIVQTPTMARDMVQWYTCGRPSVSDPVIRVLPFMDAKLLEFIDEQRVIEWDFVYVADGEAHKNHRCLLDAWYQLAQQGIRPSLALTLGPRDHAVASIVDDLRNKCNACVCNLGQMPREQVLALYQRSRALIFPSLSESFGMPLIEAKRLGLPIIAPELDYVRDVCNPVQTFDPSSSVSIARAVQRFLGTPALDVTVHTPDEFWTVLLDHEAEDR